jgi:cytochrome c553
MRIGWLIAGLGSACLVLFAIGAFALTPEPFPDWAYPSRGAKPATPAPEAMISVPGSPIRHREDDVHHMTMAVDWFPGSHPPAPAIVTHTTGDAWACGYCHLPDGQGRPENASLAGLSKTYILTQLRAFADGARQSAMPAYAPTGYMTTEAKNVPPREWPAAAAYYSQRRFVSRVKVVETASTPHVIEKAFVYAPQAGPPTPLGARIIETPASMERFEARDPHVPIIAYVPEGAVSAGAELAASGGPAAQPCALCHGLGLRGGLGPPLAGRSPSYIFRQLMAFQTGARRNPEAAPMRIETAELSQGQMIDLAAYAASLKP